MFISLIITSFYDFPGMAFVFLLRRVRQQAHIVVHVKIKQWPRFSAGFIDYEVVKCVMLKDAVKINELDRLHAAYMRDNKIFL